MLSMPGSWTSSLAWFYCCDLLRDDDSGSIRPLAERKESHLRATTTSALLVLVLVIALIQGCAQYVVTQNLSASLDRGWACAIGEITENLPADVEEEDKPPLGDVDQFRDYLKEELANKGIFQAMGDMADKPDYEVTGNILAYKRGSGAVRFLIGFGLGNAKITVELKLRRTTTGEILFAGNFKQSVSSGYESGIDMYRRVAKDFAKELSKQKKKLEKG